MRVLLPPSESKRPGGGNAIFTPESLHFRASLGETRARVSAAVHAISSDPDRAQQIFKLGKQAEKELQHNLRLTEVSGLPAIERYIGVLFDEIEIDTLDAPSREWINEHVCIQSALFGLLSAADQIPPYRLSASTRLTEELGMTLKRTWSEAFAEFAWPETFMLDLRSQDYASLAPLPNELSWVKLHIVQRTEDGGMRALNHFNKRAKGDLVKRLAASQAAISSLSDLISWAHASGLELYGHEDTHEATLVTELGVTAAN